MDTGIIMHNFIRRLLHLLVFEGGFQGPVIVAGWRAIALDDTTITTNYQHPTSNSIEHRVQHHIAGESPD
jgi:hypothetical protein